MSKKEETENVSPLLLAIEPGEPIPDGYTVINLPEMLIETCFPDLMHQGACMLWEGYPEGSIPTEQDKIKALETFFQLAISGYEPSNEKMQELRAECLGLSNDC
jgi:hypothetical protein